MIRRGGVAALVLVCVAVLAPLSTAAARRARHHSPCTYFCKHAGGLGGSPGVPPCKVVSSVIRVKAGIATVAVRCAGRRTSRGAVVIYPHDFAHNYVNDGVPAGSYDGADLLAPPHRTVTLKILLSRKAQALLSRKHSLRVDVLIELNTKPAVQATTRSNLPLVQVG